ncbi:MAG: PLP-dependent aminotransferase family protein [Pseudomonadota bacterium]
MDLPQDSFFLDPSFEGSLQAQIRQLIAQAVLSGQARVGDRLPSSRGLARHLSISRLTVTLAYQEMVAEGYLEGRGRSGYYVADTAPVPELTAQGPASRSEVDWSHHLPQDTTPLGFVEKEPNWRSFPYPFVYGQADPTLFNHSAWRACAHEALGLRDIDSLTSDYAARDDAQLIDFIVRQTLPRRGIAATPEEILITAGAQNALWLVANLLHSSDAMAVVENPGYPGLRAILQRLKTPLVPVDVDEGGVSPEAIPPQATAVYVTPSHQAPTTVTMPMARRRALLERASRDDFLLVEDDYEFEMSYAAPPTPALKSIDTKGRVIYVGSFSKSLFPGLRLGYLVAPKPVIEAARDLRSVTLRHLPGHIQRTTAYFLARGHYDALIRRLRETYAARRATMAAEIARVGLRMAQHPGTGGTSFWMHAKDGTDTRVLAKTLREQGVLIEPGAPFFFEDAGRCPYYRLAYSSVQNAQIGTGLRKIADALR